MDLQRITIRLGSSTLRTCDVSIQSSTRIATSMTELSREVAVLDEALQLPAGQWIAYLEKACAGDPELRRRVEALLRLHGPASAFFDVLERDMSPPTAVSTENPGSRVGPYKIIEPIGEGGCGMVYKAEQEQPVCREVALKVIKLGMDTKQVVARFEAERQALALMDHPNI